MRSSLAENSKYNHYKTPDYMKHTLNYILRRLTMICLAVVMAVANIGTAKAQSSYMDVTIKVGVKEGSKVQHRTVLYSVLYKRAQAENAANVLQDAINRYDNGDDNAIENAKRSLNIPLDKSKNNGTIEISAKEGMYVLIVYMDGNLHQIVEIKDNKTEYEVTLVSDRRTIEQVDVTGSYTGKPEIDGDTGFDDGVSVTFPISFKLPPGYTTDDSRLIVQPHIIDCQTEDTVDILAPLVFESARYHELQDPRMGFDYFKNDTLAVGFKKNTLAAGKGFAYEGTVTYTKRDKEKTYVCFFPLSLEDYHHVIWNSATESGSCLTFRPMKFVNLSVATADIPLTSEFAQIARAITRDIPRDLRLRFVVGKAELIDDSLNQVEKDKFINELLQHGNKLTEIFIQGGASPEGSLQINTNLAKERSQTAVNIVKARVPADVRVRVKDPRVYTWQDVVDALKQKGDDTVTETVADIVANNRPEAVFAKLKELPFYDTHITPVLENMRMMNAQYQYVVSKAMDPEEALAEYEKHKQDYMSGRKTFSLGDYYNLFQVIRDSTDMDTLTVLAYNTVLKEPDYHKINFASYVANKMAMMKIRRGTPDTEILRPFVDLGRKKINLSMRDDDFSDQYIVNRQEILINQAVSYFLSEDRAMMDTAVYLLKLIPGNDAVADNVRKFVNFKKYFIKYRLNQLSDPQEIQYAKEAELYVLGSSDENRAAIYAEMRKYYQHVPFEQVDSLLNLMDDDNPKKWYLKGILWSNRPDKSLLTGGENQEQLSDAEMMELLRTDPDKYYALLDEQDANDAQAAQYADVAETPDYMAYFQHSFDLEPKFMRFYRHEANVSDKLRKNHPFLTKDIPLYRKKASLLMQEINRRKAQNNAPAQDENE